MPLWFGLIGLLSGATGHALDTPSAAPSRPTNSVTIPLEIHRGHMMIRARVNQSEPLLFMLDSGFTITMISPEQAVALALKRAGTITIIGVAGEEPADLFEGATLDFGGSLTYTPRRLAALASHSRRSVRRDGVLGSGFYRRFVVEVDASGKSLVLHEPKSFEYSGAGEVVPLEFRKSTPIVRASILYPGEPPIEGEFEIDTGCDGGCCLAHDFVLQHRLEEKTAGGDTRRAEGVGGGARTRVVRLPKLQIGKLIVERPTADFFEKGSPVDEGLAGHIGMEILRQFRVIFDYSHKRMILESKQGSANPG
jgi:predicted aspartyl protease